MSSVTTKPRSALATQCWKTSAVCAVWGFHSSARTCSDPVSPANQSTPDDPSRPHATCFLDIVGNQTSFPAHSPSWSNTVSSSQSGPVFDPFPFPPTSSAPAHLTPRLYSRFCSAGAYSPVALDSSQTHSLSLTSGVIKISVSTNRSKCHSPFLLSLAGNSSRASLSAR